MRGSSLRTRPYLVLSREDYVVLGPSDFGSPGLEAIEVLGPYVQVKALGPLITVHDSTVEAGFGVGHHPHRYNERIFYIMTGQLHHSDTLNNITGHMETGDVGLFTGGIRGMVHSEWNNGETDCHAFILVYATDPIPEKTSFGVLKDGEAPRYEEGEGVKTKELVGPLSGLRINGDVRLFTDSSLDDGSHLEVRLGREEAGLVSVQEGAAVLEHDEVPAGGNVLFPPVEEERVFRFRARGPARLLRVVTGPGFGFRMQ
jgi:redox-sensitive bicupin YhaK (pirin superfamily)